MQEGKKGWSRQACVGADKASIPAAVDSVGREWRKWDVMSRSPARDGGTKGK